jgi:hypothetical protein
LLACLQLACLFAQPTVCNCKAWGCVCMCMVWSCGVAPASFGCGCRPDTTTVIRKERTLQPSRHHRLGPAAVRCHSMTCAAIRGGCMCSVGGACVFPKPMVVGCPTVDNRPRFLWTTRLRMAPTQWPCRWVPHRVRPASSSLCRVKPCGGSVAYSSGALGCIQGTTHRRESSWLSLSLFGVFVLGLNESRLADCVGRCVVTPDFG